MVVTTERGEETRARILSAARQLFAEHGYTGTSVSDLLKATQLTKGGFYFHFASKADLAMAVIAEATDAIRQEILAAARGERALDDLFAIADSAFAVCGSAGLVATRRLTEDLAGAPGVEVTMEVHSRGWARAVEDLIVTAQREGDVAAQIDAHAASVIIISAYFGLMEMAPALPGGAQPYKPAYLAMAADVLGVEPPT